jgi:hypothetical protein
MGKKIQALKETLPHRLPKISLPKISLHKISLPKISWSKASPAVQLVILGLALFIGVGILGMIVVAAVFKSLLCFVPLVVGWLLYIWFGLASEKLENDP